LVRVWCWSVLELQASNRLGMGLLLVSRKETPGRPRSGPGGWPDSNCYCFECKQPLTEIERDGQMLACFLHCNIWWALRGGSTPRLSAAELRSLIKRQIGTRALGGGWIRRGHPGGRPDPR